MKTNDADVLVVGSGVSGLSAALAFAEKGASVKILDAGRPYNKRYCPVDHGKTCNGCNGTCNVITGFGGCVHYGDGSKLSMFPSGRRLMELLGEDRAHRLANKALTFMFEGQEDPLRFKQVQDEGVPFTLKRYLIARIAESEISAFIERLDRKIMENRHIKLKLKISVFEIVPVKTGFKIYSVDSEGTEETVYAKRVVVAVGRYGRRWWSQQIKKLKIEHKAPNPSVGLRFECPAEYLSAIAKIHADFKTTQILNGNKIKTFCFCGGEGGGKIKFTNYGDYTSLDGHITPEGDLSVSNLALLTQIRRQDGLSVDEAWVKAAFIDPYKKIRPEGDGKPVVQWYPDFKNACLTCTSYEDFAKRVTYNSPVTDYAVGNLAGIFPEEMRDSFCEVFEQLFSFFTLRSVGEFLPKMLERVGVIGLELENMWDEVSVNSYMQSSIPNLYVVGDCAGVAQGILQAITSGLAAAEGSSNG